MVLEVTPSAFKRIKELVVSGDKLLPILRISVEGGGCAGFMYKYEFVNKVEADDFVINNENVQVAVDPISLNFMKGCKVDFIEELTGSYFSIVNPNASAKCGCNNSFSL